MNKCFIYGGTVVLALLVGTSTPSPAQVPEDPQVAPIPENARWEITPQTPPSKTAPNPTGQGNTQPATSDELIRVENTKTGNIQKVIMDYGPGAVQTVWLAQGEIYVDNNNIVSSGRVSGMSSSFYAAYGQFFGTDWITSGHYKGRTTLNKRECDYYETLEAQPQEIIAAQMAGVATSEIQTTRKAWIDVKTRLPLAVSVPEGAYNYRFLDPPASPLQLPGVFAAKQRELEAEVKRQQQEASVR
jgi:hypothetical protein